MSEFVEFIGKHTVAPIRAFLMGGWWALLVLAAFAAWPYALNTILHPSDAVGFWQWVNHFAVTRQITMSMRANGLLGAIGFLIVVILIQFAATAMLYRRADMIFITIFPAFVATGFVGNLIFWIVKGYWDWSGCGVGLSTMAPAFLAQDALEKYLIDKMF